MAKQGNINYSHPYFPKDLSLPHYVPNDKSLWEILGVFFSITAVVMVTTWVYTGRKKHLSKLARVKLCWFISCALIHFILEGYFSVYHRSLAGEQTLLAQMWKEYGKADSRYISSDTFTVCMETITAFVDGPLAFLAVYAFIANTPYRHVVQILLSLCQLYGDTLYFATEVKEDFIHGELYHPLHFWFYFMFLNSLWIIFPLACIVESCIQLTDAQATLDKNVKPSNKKLR